MNKLVRVSALLLMIAITPNMGLAQGVCGTPYGACAMNMPGVPGGPCFCVTAAGNIQGITQGPPVVAPGDLFPHFCCTPAGRIGPYPNIAIPAGQVCEAATPGGVFIGQACF